MAATVGSSSNINYGNFTQTNGLTSFTVALTINVTAANANDLFIDQWGGSTSTRKFLVQYLAGGNIGVGARGSGAQFGQQGSYTITSKIERIVCSWNTSSCQVWVNGSALTMSAWLGGSVSSIQSATVDLRAGIGIDGDYSEIAFWTSEIDSAAALSVSDGVSPLMYPQNLALYDKVLDTSSQDLIGGIVPTHTSTSKAAHPSVIYPSAQILQFPTSTPSIQYWTAGARR